MAGVLAVLIHGAGHTAAVWQDTQAALAAPSVAGLLQAAKPASQMPIPGGESAGRRSDERRTRATAAIDPADQRDRKEDAARRVVGPLLRLT